ncbi:DNA polymerase IV, partial [Blautia wexlerae]|nr:DNA polymerase IV [Blautia wexlerae]
MERVILHCDCNAFYASVECQLHPEYREVPMAVCGDPEQRHGIILAKNEWAKKYGVQT